MSKTTVNFAAPFKIAGLEDVQPAGDYVIVTSEELLRGFPIPFYHRVQTQILLHPKLGVTQTVTVNPEGLAAALKCDQAKKPPRINDGSRLGNFFE